MPVRDKGSRDTSVKIKAKRRFLRLMATSDQVSVEMNAQVDWAAVTRVHDLGDVLELIEVGLNEAHAEAGGGR